MKVLLTGANGYIGRRLKQKLVNQNISLRLFVRNPKSISGHLPDNLEVVTGNTFDKKSLHQALKGIDVAYYLVHSLQLKNYRDKDNESARNFVEAAISNGVKKIVYLGGLGVKENSSEHLLSRIETGEELCAHPDKIQTIWIRAGVIIGSGSASFEIIRHLTEKLPLMVTPKWVCTKTQPIGVDDIISYLDASKDLETNENLIIDVGSETMTYKQMMLSCAQALGLKRYIIPLPVLTINLSSYWLNIFTPVPYNLAKSLIKGLGSEVVIQNDNAKKYFPNIQPSKFIDAVTQAIKEMEENQIYSRWSDAEGCVDLWKEQHQNDPSSAILMDRQVKKITKEDQALIYNTFCSIGGKVGWFGCEWLWEIRGFIDKLIGGAGLNRGRRHPTQLRVGESIDFWRVEDLIPNTRLLLRAQMKVPGKAWLEFKIDENEFIQTAYFYPRGLWGRIYWYSLIPLHYLVFGNMIKSIYNRALQN